MYNDSVIKRWLIGGALIAAAISPAAAQAELATATAGGGVSAARQVPAARFDRDGHRLLFVRIEDQIRLVIYGAAPAVELGPNALRIYRAGGLSTAEPDAQAVRFAATGGRRSG